LTHSRYPEGPWSIRPSDRTRWSNAVLAFIRRKHIKDVVLVANWLLYQLGPDDLPQTLKDLKATGARVWIVAQIPVPFVNASKAAVLAERGLIAMPPGVSKWTIADWRERMQTALKNADPGEYRLLDPVPLLEDKSTGGVPIVRKLSPLRGAEGGVMSCCITTPCISRPSVPCTFGRFSSRCSKALGVPPASVSGAGWFGHGVQC